MSSVTQKKQNVSWHKNLDYNKGCECNSLNGYLSSMQDAESARYI